MKTSQRQQNDRQKNFTVIIRVRPPLERELYDFKNTIALDESLKRIVISDEIENVIDDKGQFIGTNEAVNCHVFFFDQVYDYRSTQEDIYHNFASNIVFSSLSGYNATIFAYGQTGTGKTYTMEGQGGVYDNLHTRGIIPRAIEQVYSHIQTYTAPHKKFLVRASYLQIYNEVIYDLLSPEGINLHIREDKKKGVYVDGLSEWVVRTPHEVYTLLDKGLRMRTTGETKMNEVSSRSHAVFILIVEQSETICLDENGVEMTPEEFKKIVREKSARHESINIEDHVRQSFKIGKLNLVDLAGSERVRLSGATGVRLEESKQINKSLASLGNVIAALTEAKPRTHIPYRDSKLTRILEDSLGGNCKTGMIGMLSPALESMGESLSTLKFANRAKNIKNEAHINEDLDQKSLLQKYERELKQLRIELEEKQKNVVDKRRLLEIDEQRRRAEADKLMAMRELEERSKEFMKEKEEKRQLEEKIKGLLLQMNGSTNDNIYNGNQSYHIDQTIQEYDLAYEEKVAELEKEREAIEEEKAQVDRYKQLILKQRDIMIALTQRLVERDEQNMALQTTLEEQQKSHKEWEEKVDEKTEHIITLQKQLFEMEAKYASLVNSSPNTNTSSQHIHIDKSIGNKVSTQIIDKCIEDITRLIQEGRNDSNLSPSRIQQQLSLIQQQLLTCIDDPNTQLPSTTSNSSNNNNHHMDTNTSLDPGEVQAIKDKNKNYVEERKALQVILEQKINVLVKNIHVTSHTLVDQGILQADHSNILLRDISALKNLVTASISALKRAS